MSSDSEKKTLAIVGLGLIGASIAEATRKRYGDKWRIIGVSSPSTIKEAKEINLIDEGFGYDQIRQALGQCDFGFLCTPIDNIVRLLEQWIKKPLELRTGAIISDVGSTKEVICELGAKAFPFTSKGRFVGSHPMAGSEKTGLKARDAHLFENAAWIVCPSEAELKDVKEDEIPAKPLQAFIIGLGARILGMYPKDHDFVASLSSHLPQLLSTTLAAYVSRSEGVTKVLEVAGGGFRDMTRLASSSFAVWEPILRTNKANVAWALSTFRNDIERLEKSLLIDGGREYFNDANMLRSQFKAPRKGFSSPTTEILIDLEDKPGVLINALSPLSHAGLNILDLEILKVREGEEGTLMMGFHKPEEAQTALDLLAKSGHKARLR